MAEKKTVKCVVGTSRERVCLGTLFSERKRKSNSSLPLFLMGAISSSSRGYQLVMVPSGRLACS